MVKLAWGAAGGTAAGGLLAPAAAAGSFIRKSRLFHPRGIVLQAMAEPVATSGLLRAAAERLSGTVFVRFSGAWWKRRQLPDVLGCAMRFTRTEQILARPAPDDQDLLFATIRNPLTTLLSPLSTNARDFLNNAYFGVSPFEIDGVGRVKLRVSAVPNRSTSAASRREQKLLDTMDGGTVRLALEVRANRVGARYSPFASIHLVRPVPIDDASLHFDPFRTGRGIQPVGFVHHLRIAAYAASQQARDLRSTRRTHKRRLPA